MLGAAIYLLDNIESSICFPELCVSSSGKASIGFNQLFCLWSAFKKTFSFLKNVNRHSKPSHQQKIWGDKWTLSGNSYQLETQWENSGLLEPSLLSLVICKSTDTDFPQTFCLWELLTLQVHNNDLSCKLSLNITVAGYILILDPGQLLLKLPSDADSLRKSPYFSYFTSVSLASNDTLSCNSLTPLPGSLPIFFLLWWNLLAHLMLRATLCQTGVWILSLISCVGTWTGNLVSLSLIVLSKEMWIILLNIVICSE